MQIYVHRNGEQLGPFTEAELKAQLEAGSISLQDSVWWEGQAEWVSLDKTQLATSPATVPSTGPVNLGPTISSPYPAPAAVDAERTSGLAIGALVTGIIGLFVGIIFIIPIILGHMSLSQIGKNPGLKGRGMGLAGLILGYVEGAIVIIIAIVALTVFMALGNQVRDTFKTINAQLAAAQAESTDTNSTTSPTTNNAPDSTTNAAPQPSGN